jgi:hypothetical protein
MRKAIGLILVLTVVTAGASRAAENDETAQLKEAVRALTERVEQVEKQPRLFSGGESWVDRISFKGDFRYRHEYIKVSEPDERDEIRHRHRVRGRIGMTAKVNDEVTFNLRLATGSDNDPVSTNQTLDEGNSKKSVWIDQLYVTYKPEALKDYGFAVDLGRVPNPFFKPGDSSLIWDGDLNFEGGNVKAEFKLDPVTIFANGSIFWCNERGSDADSGMFGLQGGIKTPIMDTGVDAVFGVSGFWYANAENEPVFYGTGSGNTVDGGNYVNQYNLIEVFGQVNFKVSGVPVSVFADFVNNSDPDEEDTGMLFGFSVGKRKEQWDWEIKYNYREVERDAVVGIFTDSDPGGGGTNVDGHMFGFGLRLAKNVDADFTYMVNNIGIADDDDDQTDYDRMQVDLVFKF